MIRRVASEPCLNTGWLLKFRLTFPNQILWPSDFDVRDVCDQACGI